MKKQLHAEVLECRGRVSRVKFPDGLIGQIPTIDIPIGSKIIIEIETKM